MATPEPHRMTATALLPLIESGAVSAASVVESCLARITEREPVVRAWAHVAGDAALAAARAASRDSLLKGLPFGVKDIFDTADMPTGYGSTIYTGCRPGFEASAVSLPRAAGGVPLGKTVTTEFANRQPGPTMNPANPDFTPGGSSSGSAAAVADFMVPLAIGTQTGGSVIRPAAYCGVVGFKPSWGLFPPAGMHPNTETLDTVGIMARAVADIALFRAALMAVPYAPPKMPERAPRLALCRTPHWEEAEPEGKAVLEEAARILARAGGEIVEAELPPGCAGVSDAQATLTAFEAPRNLAPELHRHEKLISPRLVGEKLAAGRRLSLDEFRDAWRKAERMRAAARAWAEGFDAVLTLPGPGQAPRGLGDTGSARFNALWTVLYVPCLTLPAGGGPDGLPVGIQLVGRRYADEKLLATGLWVERHLGVRS